MGGIEEISESEYREFIEKVNKFRSSALKKKEWYTDKSLIDFPFLPYYCELIRNVGGAPSVVEYGGGVPILSLFLLSKKQISGLLVIDTDDAVLRQLKKVADGLQLPVCSRNLDLNEMICFPGTDLGISVNALYGFSPRPDEHDHAPRLTRPVISKSYHKGFGVFRHLNNFVPWDELGTVISEMERNYAHHLSGEKDHVCQNWGYFRTPQGVQKKGPGLAQSRLYHVIGWDRKP